MLKATLNDFAEALREAVAAGDATVLAGAGVSMLPPASLPSGNALRDYAVSCLCADTIAESLGQQLMRDPRFQSLLPERAFQRIYEAIGDEFYKLLGLLSRSQPNAVHDLLGRIASTSCPILTTNFDQLIESCALPKNVVHLHGDLGDPATMVVRIEQVGGGLPPVIRKKLFSATRARRLFIIGYSGRDMDIMQAINSACPAEVWWLDISTPPGVAALRVESLRLCIAKLQDLVSLLAPIFDIHHIASEAVSNFQDMGRVSVVVPDWRRICCVAKLAAESGQLELSVIACEFAAPLVERPTELISLAVEAILALRGLGRLDDARDWLFRGLNVVSYASDKQKASIYNAEGFMALEEEQPQIAKSLRALRRAEMHQRRYITAKRRERLLMEPDGHGRTVFLGRIVNNIGWAYHVGGQYDKAVEAYRESLRLKRIAGDLLGVAFTTANIARALNQSGARKQAARWRSRARRYCREIGLPLQEAAILRDMAEVALKEGRNRTAVRWLDEAAQLLSGTEFELMKRSIEAMRTRAGRVCHLLPKNIEDM